MEEKTLHRLREKALSLPLSPGVYLMKNRQGEVIYVGKAKALRNRVTSYFRGIEKHFPKVRSMVERVDDFDFIVTASEFEALILECSQIKYHRPKYNILLKDDKGYSYVRVTQQEAYPRITAEFRKEQDGALYIGPYLSSYSVRQAVEETNRYYLLPTCRRRFPEEIGKARPCLNHHIKRCMGVCTGGISAQQYRKIIKEAVEYLKNGVMESVGSLRRQMEEAAERLDFEKAAYLRDRIAAVERIRSEQTVYDIGRDSLDVVALQEGTVMLCIVFLSFREGKLINQEHFLVERGAELPETMHTLIAQFYTLHDDIPRTVAVNPLPSDPELLGRFLSEKAGKKVHLYRPERGQVARLVEMASDNARQKLDVERRKDGKQQAALGELAQLLSLEGPPRRIESYDISHLSAADPVGGMVVFEDGRPLKKAYKRFAIKTAAAPDDGAALYEVLSRRFARYHDEAEHDAAFKTLPDLILVDGGNQQLAAVQRVLREQGIDLPAFGMVKDGRHRTRAITAQGEEISIASNRSVYTLVSTIQEEVHRYTIGYQKKKREKRMRELALYTIPGIGKARAAALLKQFKTIEGIARTKPEELQQVKGISPELAQRIYSALNP